MSNRYVILISLALLLFQYANAQIIESPSIDESGNVVESSSFLGQTSLGIPQDPLMPPRLALKTYKLTAEIAGTWWDFYFLNNVPTFNTNENDSIKAFSNEVLNQTGGILNIALGKQAFFANGKDTLNKAIKGGQFDFRAGTKLLDPPNRAYSEFMVPTFQTSIDLRYLIPLVAGKVKDKSELRKRMIGNLSFRIFGAWQKIFATKTYDEYFMSRKGNPPPHSLTSYGFEINLFVTNELFLSFGQTFSDLVTMPTRTVISLSYTNMAK